MLKYINELVEREEADDKKWEVKLKKKDVSVAIKKGGSDISSECPYVRTRVTLDCDFPIYKIVECIFNPKHRL